MKTLLFIQTLSFECLGFYMIFEGEVSLSVWISFFSAHALACASFSALSWLFLPNKYKFPLPRTIAFLFLFNFLLPLVGMIGTTLSLLIALYLPRKQPIATWKECETIPLPLSPNDVLDSPYGTGALMDILIHSDDTKRRALAVGAICNLPRKQAVPLLQLALKDLSDDVRLLAYASLEAVESEINEHLSLFKKQYEQTKQAHKAFEVAQQFWELCYLGIAEGALKKHYLEQAEHYLNLSNKAETRASNMLLLGRVKLAQHQPETAIQYLSEAMEGGIRLKQVAPYLAEAAFNLGNYDKVRYYVSCFPTQQGDKLSQIKEYWS